MEPISGSLEGFKEILKVLETLGDDRQVNNLLKKANREAVKPVQKAMKGLPFPARLLTSMAIRATKVDGAKHPNAVMVGPTTKVFPIRFLDKGTVERYTKEGAYRGMIEGKHVIETFMDAQAKQVQKDVVKKYGEDLVKLTAKDVKRINKKR